ncbi:MAG: RNA-binding transcriptional accessory protein [Oscillospiraceae bacterium]|nr:RNA-binding transcriptional accessory protein [Oscillospiraceae bacterium]
MENQNQKLIAQLALELKLNPVYVTNVVQLIDEGNTIPFIARYRKELHGGDNCMDDTQLRDLADRLQYLRNLEKRREEILTSIESQGKLTDELKTAISAAATLAKLEDLYLPYKQKRRTRATIAREKGLEPLAELLFAQELRPDSGADLRELAAPYISDGGDDEKLAVLTAEDALAGASDIIAENISDNAEIRGLLRTQIADYGQLASKATDSENDSVYRLYYDFTENIKNLQSHRVLAINRGEKEKFLSVSINADDVECMKIIRRKVVKHGSISSAFVAEAAEDSYNRLIFPSLEREARSTLTDMASEQAIKMFGLNLKPTLMQPPVKNMPTMGFDPAYRTGCKIAVVDETGKVLETGVVYATMPHDDKAKAARTLTRMIKQHGVKAVAIGNGTASKESEIFVAEMLKDIPGVAYMVVNEAGASVYSASKLAAKEFPDLDVSLRSAISIARRLQDPLAELVKIDPKSIGVGQYQHDMPPARLDETLTGVVESCVNAVGVDINSASPALLAYVAGLTATTAANVVAYREENGAYSSRTQIKKVPKIGPKAFEQCAGFLRVPESKNVLDNTGVHPESYDVAKKVLEIGLDAMTSGKVAELSGECGVGATTVQDIIKELRKPGRDPRDELPPTMLRTDVMDMKDLKAGMKLKGTVRNVIDFGAFIDIGVHQDGLVHVSALANKFVKHPSEVVKVGDIVDVTVISVDVGKKRIALSMKA